MLIWQEKPPQHFLEMEFSFLVKAFSGHAGCSECLPFPALETSSFTRSLITQQEESLELQDKRNTLYNVFHSKVPQLCVGRQHWHTTTSGEEAVSWVAWNPSLHVLIKEALEFCLGKQWSMLYLIPLTQQDEGWCWLLGMFMLTSLCTQASSSTASNAVVSSPELYVGCTAHLRGWINPWVVWSSQGRCC